jgi:hypothetical protein
MKTSMTTLIIKTWCTPIIRGFFFVFLYKNLFIFGFYVPRQLSLTMYIHRVIHERGISEFLFAATHYTHCNNILISNFEKNYN